MHLTDFNNIASMAYDPTKKLTELFINQDYMISNIKQVQTTKYGKKFVAVIVEKEQEFDVFLPKRICKLFKKDEKTYNQFCDAAHKSRLFCRSLGAGRLVFNIVNNEEKEPNDE